MGNNQQKILTLKAEIFDLQVEASKHQQRIQEINQKAQQKAQEIAKLT